MVKVVDFCEAHDGSSSWEEQRINPDTGQVEVRFVVASAWSETSMQPATIAEWENTE